MTSRIILRWDNIAPHEIYAKALAESPIYFDDIHQSWVVYSHPFCKSILLNTNAQIPKPVWNDLLNDKANSLINKLTRLSNSEQHLEARLAAELVYKKIQPVSVSKLLQSLINEKEHFNWVDTVCKKLPVLVILTGLGCNDAECNYVVSHIETMVKLLSLQKTIQEINAINDIMDDLFLLAEELIARVDCFQNVEHDKEKWTELCTCNLIGLLIQSYDAGWGLLCNSMMQFAKQSQSISLKKQDINYFKKAVVETLRFDPPVHLTKRIATSNISIGDHIIKEGENIQLILAASNLDPQIFSNPLSFDPLRANNADHLTFGAGGHTCLAKYLIIDIATEACRYLYTRFDPLAIPAQTIDYERKLNVRLVRKLLINVNN